MLLPQPHPQPKDTQRSRLVASGIVLWKKHYCFEDDLCWNTFQKPPSIQWHSKLNTGNLLEDSDVEHSFEIISTAKKSNAPAITRAAKRNFFLFFQCVSLKPIPLQQFCLTKCPRKRITKLDTTCVLRTLSNIYDGAGNRGFQALFVFLKKLHHRSLSGLYASGYAI